MMKRDEMLKAFARQRKDEIVVAVYTAAQERTQDLSVTLWVPAGAWCWLPLDPTPSRRLVLAHLRLDLGRPSRGQIILLEHHSDADAA